MASSLHDPCGSTPHAGQSSSQPAASRHALAGHFFVFLPDAAALSDYPEVIAPAQNAALCAAKAQESTSIPGRGSHRAA
ncbi:MULTISPECIES: hypothetical protein [Pseudomonas]|uniref:hypothetical protein n=1 Tax=Pseudomonas TaxID=286 RepID=UPI0005EAE851|nr:MULTISPECIES: hypothetical protein [Pseudomonas]KJJ94599.1 hypothetical protein UB43_27865 [Pseudomonas sp. 21]MBV7586196.1 hypothetical protein [Pseudomonas sp. PDM33]NMZ61018.1 hypothetical protein [Pseudomonas nitroreducens]SNT47110.1 hypothetical protein SAMN05216209_5479 [Pseudomonas nitroreducens]